MKIAGKDVQLGIMLRREQPPEQLALFAHSTEDAGYDELWVVEDCFYPSGIATAASALALTRSITVGLGIMPAVARNPVFAAMEIATLARLYPGRFLPGFGHGVAEWMEQIGALPKSQLKALGETAETVKRLLHGEHFSFDGTQVHVNDVGLVFPPAQIPPVSLGVRGQKSLQLAGRVADGTILAEFASPAYVKWAREQIALGQAEAGISTHHRLTVFVMAYLGSDQTSAFAQAKANIVTSFYGDWADSQIEPMGILPQVKDMRARKTLESELPDAWIHDLVMVGGHEECQRLLQQYAEAGVDTIVLVPPPEQAVTAPGEISARLMSFVK